MDKIKKVEFKKTLVRNTVQPFQKSSSTKEIPKSETRNHPIKSVHIDNCKLDKPTSQSTLRLVKTIDTLTKHGRAKSVTGNDKLAVDEKVTRKVNFPYDQPIYKDLIPLEVDQCKTPPIISSRGPLPHKDEEPVLTDFLIPKTMSKYYSFPYVKVENKINTITSNNLRLYHIIEKYNLKQ